MTTGNTFLHNRDCIVGMQEILDPGSVDFVGFEIDQGYYSETHVCRGLAMETGG